MNKIKYQIIISSVFVAFIMASCSHSRKIIKAPIKEQGQDYLFRKLKKNEFCFNTLYAKFSVDYKEDKSKYSFNGQLRIKKDSVIWLSFSPALGIEAVRLLITQDTIKFLNRIDKNYIVSDFSFINDYINNALDFNMIQSLLIGNDFDHYDNKHFKASIDNKRYKLSTIKRHKIKKYIKDNKSNFVIPVQHIWLNPKNFKIEKIDIKEIAKGKDKKFSIKYFNKKPVNNQLFPFSYKIEINAEKKFKIYIDHKKVSVGKSLKFPFRIPKKYNKSNCF